MKKYIPVLLSLMFACLTAAAQDLVIKDKVTDETTREPLPHEHTLLKIVNVTAISGDGSEVTSAPLGPDFPKGFFVAMPDNKTFEIYTWEGFF